MNGIKFNSGATRIDVKSKVDISTILTSNYNREIVKKV